MSQSNTGKSFDDYREIIKQLKFKVKKQQTEINELREENQKIKQDASSAQNETTINNTIINAKRNENLEEDERAILDFYKIVSKFGLNLEMLFRCADKNSTGLIGFDEFRVFLNKLKIMELTSSKIMRFLYVFDDDLSGKIRKEDYYFTLKIFNVNEEELSSNISSVSVIHSVLNKFVHLHKNQKDEQIFKFIDTANKGFASEKRILVNKIYVGDSDEVKQKQDELWHLLKNFEKWNCMIGCSAVGGTEHNILVNGEDTGLMSGHAYALLNLIEIDRKKEEIENSEGKKLSNKIRLLRIRNPWGYGEWKLKWSEEEAGQGVDNGGDENAPLNKYLNEITQFFNNLKEEKKKKNEDYEEFDPFADDGYN